jgi:hypothetical protein
MSVVILNVIMLSVVFPLEEAVKGCRTLPDAAIVYQILPDAFRGYHRLTEADESSQMVQRVATSYYRLPQRTLEKLAEAFTAY